MTARIGFDVLRRKWGEVPAGLVGRASTKDLLALPDRELVSFWRAARAEATTGAAYSVRGWYHELYRDVLRGRSVLDVGCGMGMDGLTFAEHGARMTLADISPANLELVGRMAGLLGVSVKTSYIEDVASLARLEPGYDVVWAQGSLINLPFDQIREEAAALLERLPVGGRWIELAYPKERWEREGRLPFERWAALTDGPGTPWVEWYDLERLRERLAPAVFDVVLHFNFHGDDFNWFDLRRRG